MRLLDAGWSSLAARRAHNPKVAGSNPAPATNLLPRLGFFVGLDWRLSRKIYIYQPLTRLVGNGPCAHFFVLRGDGEDRNSGR